MTGIFLLSIKMEILCLLYEVKYIFYVDKINVLNGLTNNGKLGICIIEWLMQMVLRMNNDIPNM
ncbi:hypothetical protein GCM10023093_18560 [Nemorincola caseinilytica]|uniref:Uncharacterized protein n=1 Tax=Nemorincola caseinilytica TaxID=2054315 RepID=A0ABP8NH99_9BACT